MHSVEIVWMTKESERGSLMECSVEEGGKDEDRGGRGWISCWIVVGRWWKKGGRKMGLGRRGVQERWWLRRWWKEGVLPICRG